MKVIYHIDNNSKWKMVLENVKNYISKISTFSNEKIVQ